MTSMRTIAQGILDVVGVYLGCGFIFAAAFQWRGLGVVDPATVGTGWGFRLVITPGLIALWPLMALRSLATRAGRSHEGGVYTAVSDSRLRRWHGLAWKMLAVVVPLLAGAALAWRPVAAPPQMLPAGALEIIRTSGQP